MPTFDTGSWVSFVIIGVLAAFFVGYLTKGRGFGWLGNLVLGVTGAIVGPVVYALVMKLTNGKYDFLNPLPTIPLADLAKAMIGAFLLLLIVSFVRKKKT